MLDFLMISTRSLKKDVVEVYPNFVMKKSSDLMIRGGDFYAVWMENRKCWSTEEQDIIDMVDREIDIWLKSNPFPEGTEVHVKHMWDAKSGAIDSWHKYCQKQMRDNFHPLNQEIIFANTPTTKESYSSMRLPYSLEPCEMPAYDKIISTLYSEEERRKIEWAIGAIVTGHSKSIQKFLVLYGDPGTGKSTIIDIIQKLFDGYCTVFDARSLGSSRDSFSLEPLKENPRVAIQHDADLSRIEDNTRLNSLIAHEIMPVNVKNKNIFSMRFNSFLIIGTNRPVKISEAKSGLTRRLIDVTPTGRTLPYSEYSQLCKQVEFELGGIAYHCKEVYESNPTYYNNYISKTMLGATNDFYNFVMDSFLTMSSSDGVTLKAAWERYKTYCEETKVSYPVSQRVFREELRSYFKEFKERCTLDDGTRVRNYYLGFRSDKFDPVEEEPVLEDNWIDLKKQESVLDLFAKDCPAQYGREGDIPRKPWVKVGTTLKDLNTEKVHFVKIHEDNPNHIVLDFDLKNDKGEKDLQLNILEAKQWPKTYAEVSKGGQGLHLHYLYSGDVSELANLVKPDVEVKVYSGDSSLRRKLTLCNNLPIATISSGLPRKKKTMLNTTTLENEKHLRAMIQKNLKKEIHSATTPSMSFIKQLLDEAYSSGMDYDVSDLYNSILIFAMNSTNQRDNCLKMVEEMKFKSEDPSHNTETRDKPIAFFDIEIFPNLFLVCWKLDGEKEVHRMINPSPGEIEELVTNYRLIGFNNRKYDNHILYGRLLGYSVPQLYELSNRIINGERNTNATFREAYNLSYTDIYDFATKKQSLKKWEIEMGIHHQELGFRWDEPVPEEKWPLVASYCENDVDATEALFHHLKGDFNARKMLAKLTGMTVNDTTNTLTGRLIFGNDRHPQSQFIYTDLSEEFPEYKFVNGKSYYKDELVGEGGFVYSVPGIYYDVVTEDVTSMHPHSAIALCIFGPVYTKMFQDLVLARLAAKHKDREQLKILFDGKLAEFADARDEDLDDLAAALKIAINSVYGLTSAKFDNLFRDPRNVDNIVAKRGALFMATLRDRVLEMGYPVMHIKTDSIKIPKADDYILNFIVEFGKKYGYSFEVEDKYKKICLVNKAVYIAQHHDGTWTATGAQFQEPYVFKTLFSKETIEFEDMCQTFSSQTALYLDRNEGLPDVSEYEKELKKLQSKKEGDYTERIEELKKLIAEGHRYIFVGKVGQFCPMKPGVDAGGLFAISKNGDKYNAAGGTKGYLWMESEEVKAKHLEEWIDRSYFEKLCTEAVETIEEFGDFDKFVND